MLGNEPMTLNNIRSGLAGENPANSYFFIILFIFHLFLSFGPCFFARIGPGASCSFWLSIKMSSQLQWVNCPTNAWQQIQTDTTYKREGDFNIRPPHPIQPCIRVHTAVKEIYFVLMPAHCDPRKGLEALDTIVLYSVRTALRAANIFSRIERQSRTVFSKIWDMIGHQHRKPFYYEDIV